MAADTVLLSWSGGKDSVMCLHRLRSSGIEVAGLVTTLVEDTGIVSGQGIPRELLRLQARSLGLPLAEVPMPEAPSNRVYQQRLGQQLAALGAETGARAVAFGDLFLEDIRRWREDFLAGYALEGRFPLWGADTRRLIREFLELGYRAWITCVDPDRLDESFAGRALDSAALAAMDPAVDPCGENGEFHSFVVDGPGFDGPVACRPAGRVASRTGVCCRLEPGNGGAGL